MCPTDLATSAGTLRIPRARERLMDRTLRQLLTSSVKGSNKRRISLAGVKNGGRNTPITLNSPCQRSGKSLPVSTRLCPGMPAHLLTNSHQQAKRATVRL